MTFEEALTRIDSLAPNSFTKEEKVHWLNDCESLLRLEAVKQYAYAETGARDGLIPLPKGVRSEDVVKVYIDGIPIRKYDVRSGSVRVKTPDRNTRVGIVFLQRHVPCAPLCYEGEIAVETGAVTLQDNPFYSGQDIAIDCPLLQGEFTVLGSSADRLFLDMGETTVTSGTAEGTVTLQLNVPLCAPAPYDSIYIYYVTAQMDYYNKDFESYNHNSILFQDTLEELQKWERRTAALDRTAVIRNVW